jgi:hypothetical protein
MQFQLATQPSSLIKFESKSVRSAAISVDPEIAVKKAVADKEMERKFAAKKGAAAQQAGKGRVRPTE